MRSDVELKLDRRNTDAYIASNPTTITLKPQHRVRSTTGGFITPDDPERDPQVVRIIDISGVQARHPEQNFQRTFDGEMRSVNYVFLGAHDVEWEQYDIWVTDNGAVKWEITSLFPDNGYERRAYVVRYGA